MRDRVLIAAAIVGALCGAGCQSRSMEAASVGAPPTVEIPVGPVPGAGPQGPLPANPYAGNDVATAQGRELFVYYNCYGCHGGHGGGGMGPSLRDGEWLYGGSDAHIFNSIAQGRAHGMPAWGTKVPQDQIWKLVAYLKSMGTPAEPQPPPPFPANTPSDKQVMKR